MTTERRQIGWFEGALAATVAGTGLATWLGDLESLLEVRPGGVAGQGGTRLVELDAPGPDGPVPLMVKVYPRQSLAKDFFDRRRGTAAERAWRAALRLQTAGVGTPEPLAWLERWRGRRLHFSCFITRRVDGLSNLRDELMHLLRREAYADRLLALLLEVARAVRALHRAGVYHGDLGNQNILLRRTGEDRWEDVQFVDLNRAILFRGQMPPRMCARDVARLYFPSDLRRIFLQMYFGARTPPGFRQMEEHFRRRFAWHSRSRLIRHPLRQWRIRRATDPQRTYPRPADLWIWDEKSAQPINAWRRRDRERLYPWGNYRLLARVAIRRVAAVEAAYRDLRATAYSAPVELAGRWAVAVEPRPETWEREQALLQPLGRVPVLMRCYRHKGVRQWDLVVRAARELAAAGHPVALALVQDRRAVVEPAAWAAMAERVLPQLAGVLDWVEVGHAVNRVKWGLWRLSDYARLVEPLADLRDAYPALNWMGPAGIDFEYLHVLGALAAVPRGFHFNALSHHLYVDRRGAPEHRQGRFDAVDKFALARAVARASGRCGDRLIVSEVNWPLADTGVYSPVCSPYLYPGQVVGAPNVSEDDYADFMVRYLLQAACSGFVERVYWWRLAARGFGLVDEAADPWRQRPAYHALVHLLQTVGNARFLRNLPCPEGSRAHLLQRPDGEQVVVAYAWQAAEAWRPAFRFTRAESRAGTTFTVAPERLSGHPVYFRDVTL
jgi:hypothetical protein